MGQRITCPRCAKRLPPVARFCRRCGSAVDPSRAQWMTAEPVSMPAPTVAPYPAGAIPTSTAAI